MKRFTMAEAVSILTPVFGVTEQEIRRKIREGIIASERIGNKYFVSDDTLYAEIQNNSKQK